MKPTVWLVVDAGALVELEETLGAEGVDVRRTPAGNLEQVAAAAYDGRGLLLVDARGEAGRAALADQASAALPVVALVDADAQVSGRVLPLPADQDLEVLSHHLREVINEPSNLRRHPRIRVALPARLDGGAGWQVRDASLYGMWIEPAGDLEEQQSTQVEVALDDGAVIHLEARVIAIRGAGAALRCRPRTDEDLLLWLHLILGGLVQSPLHAEIDPFGPLFE